MKNFFTVLLLGASLCLMAQHTFGITGGAQLTSLHSRDDLNNFPDPQIGFRLGALYEYEFAEKFGLRTELGYSLTGGKTYRSEHLYLSYISLPILGVYSPVKKLNVYLGPELNVFLDDHATGPAYNSNEFKRFDFGVSLGSEFRITESFGVSLRNYFGLIHSSELDSKDLAPIQDGDPIMGYEGRIIKFNRHNILQLSVTYFFKK